MAETTAGRCLARLGTTSPSLVSRLLQFVSKRRRGTTFAIETAHQGIRRLSREAFATEVYDVWARLLFLSTSLLNTVNIQ